MGKTHRPIQSRFNMDGIKDYTRKYTVDCRLEVPNSKYSDNFESNLAPNQNTHTLLSLLKINRKLCKMAKYTPPLSTKFKILRTPKTRPNVSKSQHLMDLVEVLSFINLVIQIGGSAFN